MKISICNDTFQDRSFEQQCETAAALGYQGLEIAPFTISPKHDATLLEPSHAEYLLSTAHFHGLEIVGLHNLFAKTNHLNHGHGFHLTSPLDTLRNATLQYTKHLIDLCYAMEGTILAIGAAPQRSLQPDWSVDDSAHRAADLLRQLADYAAPKNITLALQPLPHTHTNFLTSTREAAILLNLIDHPHCQLLLDTTTLSHELDPQTPGTPTPEGLTPTRQQIDTYIAQLIRHHQNRLVHFHLNDPTGKAPGTSEIDHRPAAQALHDTAYPGWISVHIPDPTPSPNDLARQSLNFLKKTYRHP